MKKNNKKGFTLVELLVVIAILAILATVSVVGYSSFTKQAKASVASQEMSQIKTILLADWLDGFVGETSASNTTSITKVATGYSTTASTDDLKAVFGTDKVEATEEVDEAMTAKSVKKDDSVSGLYVVDTADTKPETDKHIGDSYYKLTEETTATEDSTDKYYTYTPHADAVEGKEADENFAYAEKITFEGLSNGIITSVKYEQGNGYIAIWDIVSDNITTEAA